MRQKLVWFLLLSLLITTGMTGSDDSSAKGQFHFQKQRSTWIWNTSLITTESEKILEFLINNQVNALYLQINRDLPIGDYQSFIKKAGKQGIKVFALEGSPNWLDPNNTRKELFLKWIKLYQQKSAADQKFKGIHIDVEPYAAKEWKIDYENTVKKYQDILLAIQKEATSMNLPLVADIPFWFDDRPYSNTTHGKGILSEWVIRNVDRVTIMAYRDSIIGNNGILKITKDELLYANHLQKKVEIALETKPLPNQGYLTFYEEGNRILNNTVSLLEFHFQNNSSFDGVSIHSYEYWTELKR